MPAQKEHAKMTALRDQLASGKMNRREFVRFAALLGLSSVAAYSVAGQIMGEGFAPAARVQSAKKGGVLKIGMRVMEVSSPHTYSWVFDSNVGRCVHEYLTRTDADNVTRPLLLENWAPSDDLMSWDLTLRKDVKWHKGREFVAADVVWNLKRVLDPALGSSVIGLMKGYMLDEYLTGGTDTKGQPLTSTRLWREDAIEAIDDHTVRLKLKVPQVAVPEHLFHYPLAILDPEEGGSFGVGANGTGAFKLIEHEVGVRSVLKANPDYWGEGPYLDEVHFVDLGDNPSASAAALASKQVHGIYDGNVDQLDLVKALPHVDVYMATTAETAVARMQVDSDEVPAFKDARVRKAMRLSIDPVKIFSVAHKDVGSVAEHHHVCSVHPDYKELDFMARDLAKAKDLMSAAGYSNGMDVEIACKKDPAWELAAVEAMTKQWREAGIRVAINVMPSAQFWDVWDQVPFGFTTWVHRPLGFMVLSLAYRTGVPWNETHFSDPEFDDLLTRAEGTLDIAERTEIIGQLETIMQKRGPIVQPLWRGTFAGYDKRVRGFKKHPTNYIFAEQLSLGT